MFSEKETKNQLIEECGPGSPKAKDVRGLLNLRTKKESEFEIMRKPESLGVNLDFLSLARVFRNEAALLFRRHIGLQCHLS